MVGIIESSEVKFTKTNKPFLSVNAILPGGERIKGIMFDYSGKEIPAGAHVKMAATEEIYNGQKQLKISQIEQTSFNSKELSLFIAATTQSIDEMWNTLNKIVDQHTSGYIKQTIKTVFELHGEKIKQAPAAREMHHNWIGGLLEHITELCLQFLKIETHYPYLNKEKVLFGLILHDICKIYEYRWDRGIIEYTKEGELLPHIPRSIQLLTRIMDKIDVPQELQDELLHIIQAHHGSPEAHSPVIPKTLEALMVHMLDNMHAQMWNAIKHVEKHLNTENEMTSPLRGQQNARFMVPKINNKEDNELPF